MAGGRVAAREVVSDCGVLAVLAGLAGWFCAVMGFAPVSRVKQRKAYTVARRIVNRCGK